MSGGMLYFYDFKRLMQMMDVRRKLNLFIV